MNFKTSGQLGITFYFTFNKKVYNLRCIVTRNHALYLARTRRGSHTIETKVPKGRKNCTVKREVIKLLG